MSNLNWKLIVLSLMMSGCAQMCTPDHEKMRAEEVLEAYLHLAFNMEEVSQRESLLRYTSGALEAAIAGANEQTLREAYIDREYELHHYELVAREDLTPRETRLTYRLKYREIEPDRDLKTPIVVTQNVVLMMRDQGKWHIHDVLANETTIDFPLEQPE